MRIRHTAHALAMAFTFGCLCVGLTPASRGHAAPAAPAVSHPRLSYGATRLMRPYRSLVRQAVLDAEKLGGLREIPSLRTRTSDTYVGADGIYNGAPIARR